MRREWAALWLALCCAAGVFADEKSDYLDGTGPLYHTTAQIHARLRRFSSGNWMRNVTLRDAGTGNTNQLYRVYNTRRAPSPDALPTVMLICNQHAREVITGEICFWLLRLLAQDPTTLLQWPEMQAQLKKVPALARLNPSGGAVTRRQLNTWTANLLTKVKVEVVPVVNKEGRDYIARTADYNQRKTVRTQVDLNRNWVTNRAAPGSGANELDRRGEEYEGPFALSEWQTRTIYTYAKSQQAKKALFIDVHSGTWALMPPFGGVFDYTSIPTATLDKWQALISVMQYSFRDATNSIGIAASFGSALLYASQGSADDTAYSDLGFPYVLTVETYAPLSASDNGIGWTCPGLRYQQLMCRPSNLCNGAVCKDRSGAPQNPSVGKHAAAEAANAAAGLAEAQAAEAAVQAAAAAAGGVSPSQLDMSSDPFLKGLANSFSASVFYAFCPATAASYRDAVAKWLVAFLGAFDHVASNL